MSSYYHAHKPNMCSVHFVRDHGTLDDAGEEITAALKENNVKVFYVDFSDFVSSPFTLATILGEELDLDNRPYEAPDPSG